MQVQTTKLSLAEWASEAGIHPLHFFGISLDVLTKNLTSVCQSAWLQKDWQASDGVSRDQVTRAIRMAEDSIEQYLGYPLTPEWKTDRIRLPQFYDPSYAPFHVVNNRWNAFAAPWGQFIEAGSRSTEPIAIGEPITWETPDATEDPLTNWAYNGTVTVADVTDNVADIRIFYPGEGGNELAEIRPVTKSLDANTGILTVTIPRQLCVKASHWNSIVVTTRPVRGESPTYDANFIDEVDVYRVTTDPSDAGSLGWNSWNGCPSCSDSTCYACQSHSAAICVQVLDPKTSRLLWTAATYDDAYGTYSLADWCGLYAPEWLTLNYKAGFRSPSSPLDDRIMEPILRNAVMQLSMSMIERPPCGCLTRRFEEAQKDLRLVQKGESYDLSADYKNSPFGTKRGAVEAWRIVSKFPRMNRNSKVAFA